MSLFSPTFESHLELLATNLSVFSWQAFSSIPANVAFIDANSLSLATLVMRCLCCTTQSCWGALVKNLRLDQPRTSSALSGFARTSTSSARTLQTSLVHSLTSFARMPCFCGALFRSKRSLYYSPIPHCLIHLRRPLWPVRMNWGLHRYQRPLNWSALAKRPAGSVKSCSLY